MTRTILKVLMVIFVGLVFGVKHYFTLKTAENDYSRMMQFMLRQQQQQHYRHLKHYYFHQTHQQQQLYHNEQNESIDRLIPRNQPLSINQKQYDPVVSQKFSKKNTNSLLSKYNGYDQINLHSLNYIKNEKNPLDQENNVLRNHLHCTKCLHHKHPVKEPQRAHFNKDELTQLRIELVKQQILEKLRLKERPQVAAVALPKPISEGTTIEQEFTDDTKRNELDDYYARTSKKYIFLEIEKRECRKLDVQPSICFSFKIEDADADGYDVNTATLWLFKSRRKQHRRPKNPIKYDQRLYQRTKETIIVSEVEQQLNSNFLPIVKTIAIQTVNVEDEWMQIDIEWPIKRWFGNHDLSHLIQIICQSCDIEAMEHTMTIDRDYRPFIMVDTQNRRKRLRQKRSVNCSDGLTECCREKLYISFDEIGWGDWIIHPRGYNAYFCRGSCKSVASITMSMSQHSSTLHKLLTHPDKRRHYENMDLVPCCTAKQYSSLQLMFMDSNNTAAQKTFPNMVVESCGCR